jgi:hypothetical protein
MGAPPDQPELFELSMTAASSPDGKRNFLFFREFGGMVRKALRQSIPDKAFYYLQNLMPVGAANLQTVRNPATISSVTNAAQGAAWGVATWGVNLSTGDFELTTMQNGDLWATPLANPGTPTVSAQIGTSVNIKGVVAWSNTVALLVGPSGYYSWDGDVTHPIVKIASADSITILLSGVVGTYTVGENVNSTFFGGVVLSWDGATNQLIARLTSGSVPAVGVTITGATSGATGVVVTATASAPPTAGTAIMVYAGRVWVSSGRTVQFSGPADYTAASWYISVGSGSFVITDNTLKSDIRQLIAANGYGYIFGDTSIDVISNLYIPTGAIPPTPIFTRTNINPQIGSPYPQSVFTVDRVVMFFNRFGVHALAGVEVQRVSKDIDTLIQQLDLSGGALSVSGSTGLCNNLLTVQFLVHWLDPMVSTSLARATMISNFDGRWFLYDPVLPATHVPQTICSVVQGGVSYSALVTNGKNVANFQSLIDFNYQGADTQMQRTFQTALWDMGGSVYTKQAMILGLEGNVINVNFSLSAEVDNENGTGDQITLLPSFTTWINRSNQTVTWLNASLQTVTWPISGYAYAYGDVTQYGKYLGVTAQGFTGDAVISGVNMEYIVRQNATWELKP